MRFFLCYILFLLIVHKGFCQNIEKIRFDSEDSASGYYLAIRPVSNQIKGTIVLLTSFLSAENLLPETKLHNVGYANDILVVYAYMKQKFYADSSAMNRLNTILKNIVERLAADPTKFVLGGYNEAGSIALRYTELSYEHSSAYYLQPRAVFGIDSPVDLFGLWRWSENQVRKNFWPGSVGDGHFYLDALKKGMGAVNEHPEIYKKNSPFVKDMDGPGNEQFLKNVAVRLYYDTDIDWHLKNRRNSFYDTNIPDGSELIKRLLLEGNESAEFIASKSPGIQSNGLKRPNALSIMDEVDCIQWVKRSLHIFDVVTWVPPYHFEIPAGWNIERFSLPPDFAPKITFQGIEDLRFPPGWGESSKQDYWSYSYVWWLEGDPFVDATSLEQNLAQYYSGLVGRNIISRKIPLDKQVPLTVKVQKQANAENDLETYSATIHMLDYMTQKPITLHAFIHKKDCRLQKHTALFIEISPRAESEDIWKQLGKLQQSFQCSQ